MNSLEVSMTSFPERLPLFSLQGPLQPQEHVCSDGFCTGLPAFYWLALYKVNRTYFMPGEDDNWYDEAHLIDDPMLYATGLPPQCFSKLCEAKTAHARMDAYASELNQRMPSRRTQYRAEIHLKRLPDSYSKPGPLTEYISFLQQTYNEDSEVEQDGSTGHTLDQGALNRKPIICLETFRF